MTSSWRQSQMKSTLKKAIRKDRFFILQGKGMCADLYRIGPSPGPCLLWHARLDIQIYGRGETPIKNPMPAHGDYPSSRDYLGNSGSGRCVV